MKKQGLMCNGTKLIQSLHTNIVNMMAESLKILVDKICGRDFGRRMGKSIPPRSL